MPRRVLDNGAVRGLAIVMAIAVGTAGVLPAATALACAAGQEMPCAAEDAGGDAPRLERACCCVRVPDGHERRAGDPAELRGHDSTPAAARAMVALAAPLHRTDLRAPTGHRTWVPPPSLLEARTAFLI